jgi:hypothetical protein
MNINKKKIKVDTKEILLNNPNDIANTLKNLLNVNQYNYNFKISTVEYKNKISYDVYISDGYIPDEYSEFDEPCLSISFINLKIDIVSINIDSIFKCSPIPSYGVFILKSLKELARILQCYSIIIGKDASYLDFYFHIDGEKKYVFIELAKLSILSTGESWYNRMGFYNTFSTPEIKENKKKINKLIGDIDNSDIISSFIEKELQTYKKLNNKPPICLQIINNYESFYSIYDSVLNNTNSSSNDTIQKVFKNVNLFIRNNCDTNKKTCSIDYFTIRNIKCFIYFVYELLDIKYSDSQLEWITQLNGGTKKKTRNKKLKRTRKTKRYKKLHKYE